MIYLLFAWLSLQNLVSTTENQDFMPPEILHHKTPYLNKSSIINGSKILECRVNGKEKGLKREEKRMITWHKWGFQAPIFTFMHPYPPKKDVHFNERIKPMGKLAVELSGLNRDDQGWYRCSILRVDQNGQVVSGPWIYLDVNYPPVINSSSSDYIIKHLHDNLHLVCQVDSKPPANVRWMKDGKVLELFKHSTLRVFPRIKISSGNNLVVNNLSSIDAGLYKCEARNEMGTSYKEFSVIVKSEIWSVPRNMTVKEGDRVEVVCGAPTTHNSSISWQKDNTDIIQIPNILKRSQLFDNRLVLERVEGGDTGWIKCVVTIGNGKKMEAKVFINVTYPPKILPMPSKLLLPLYFSSKIECFTNSNPPITSLIWYKDNIPLESSYKQGFFVNGSVLMLNNVTSHHQGIYSCTAYSVLGPSRFSPNVKVLVKPLPIFTHRPEPFYQRQTTQSLVLPCRVSGDPDPVISWKKTDDHLPPKSRIKLISGNLQIVNLAYQDSGTYECVASNPVATITTFTEVIVEVLTPHPPLNLTGTFAETSVFLSWQPGFDSGYPLHYLIWYRKISKNLKKPSNKKDLNWETLAVPISPSTREVLSHVSIHQLEMSTSYEVMVMMRNPRGLQLFSSPIFDTTLHDGSFLDEVTFESSKLASLEAKLFPQKPMNLSVRETPQGSLFISWHAPFFFTKNSSLTNTIPSIKHQLFNTGFCIHGTSPKLITDYHEDPKNSEKSYFSTENYYNNFDIYFDKHAIRKTQSQNKKTGKFSWEKLNEGRVWNKKKVIGQCYVIQYKTVSRHWVVLADVPSYKRHFNWSTASRGVKYHIRIVPTFVEEEAENGNRRLIEGQPSEVVVVDAGDPILPNREDDETMTILIGGIALIGFTGLFLVVLFRCFNTWKSHRKRIKTFHCEGPDESDHISESEVINIKRNRTIKETPI